MVDVIIIEKIKIMSKIKYIITPKGEWFKVEVWDEYGNHNSVYEKSELIALEYVIEWFSKSEKREESNRLMNKAIRECIKIDKESGITSRNRDCLD